ncbi:MAG: DUF554 domain-containing protein [Clostridia bacterium]|nr:DUF554 domain-containing protein [Clostridia bacterium]
MLGTIVNAIAIIAGALLGNFFKKGFPENIKTTVMHSLSLTVTLIGLSMALQTNNLLILTLSIVCGGILGEILKIEAGLNLLGTKLEQRFGGNDGNFTRAFVSASLIYCTGAMAIVGAIESGLTGNHNTLLVKSILDGVLSIVIASTMGIGVAFSALPVFLYQGSITIAAGLVKTLLTEAIIQEMTAAGGLLIVGIGINLFANKNLIRIGNLLPAIFVAIFFTLASSRLPF